MRNDGIVATGGYENRQGPDLPRGRTVDPDELRERREQAAADRAARNPFHRPQGQPRSKSEARVLGDSLVDRDYEKAAFSPPPPAPDVKPQPKEEPVPTPAPKLRPPAAPNVAAPGVDAAGIVRDYVDDAMPAPAIARARGLSVPEVHRVLEETPGVEVRAERADEQPAPRRATTKKARDAQIVELYTGPEQLTQPRIAERLGYAVSTVNRTLRNADVPARPRKRRAPSQVADEVAQRPDATLVPAPEPEQVPDELPAAAPVSVAPEAPATRTGATPAATPQSDDVDEHLAVLADALRVRAMLTDAGSPTTLLDGALTASTKRLDTVVTHELETLRLLQGA